MSLLTKLKEVEDLYGQKRKSNKKIKKNRKNRKKKEISIYRCKKIYDIMIIILNINW